MPLVFVGVEFEVVLRHHEHGLEDLGPGGDFLVLIVAEDGGVFAVHEVHEARRGDVRVSVRALDADATAVQQPDAGLVVDLEEERDGRDDSVEGGDLADVVDHIEDDFLDVFGDCGRELFLWVSGGYRSGS